MISEELKNIVDRFNQEGKMYFFAGATEEQIALFEKEYEVTLPLKFKEWLCFCDGGECFLPAGVQFYGVVHKPVINVKDNDRPDDNYIVIGRLASGDPILCGREGEQISIYNHEAGRIESDEIYADFFSFLNDLYELLGMGD